MSRTHAFETTPGKLATPFNLFAAVVIPVGLVLTVMRFTGGLGAITNLDHSNPWGIWIGFDLLCGVALAAGGFTCSAACYIFGLKRFHAAVRPALLTAFLGYAFVVLALHYDVGRPWRLPYPIFVQSGTTSILFEVGLCVFLYLTVLFLEFVPAVLERLGFSRPRNVLAKMTLALTVLGVILSTMHQSSLGALFLIAPSKLHPLWYSHYIPVYFFVSAVYAGLCMVIFEGALSHTFLPEAMDPGHVKDTEAVVIGFAKSASFIMMGYVCIKLMGMAADHTWAYLGTGYGLLYMTELVGLTLVPAFLLAMGGRERNLRFIRWGAVLAVLGVALNRLSVSLLAFNYHLPPEERYVPHWMEIAISIFIVTLLIVVFRFLARRLPIFREHPDYPH